jgi:hypothetical protein
MLVVGALLASGAQTAFLLSESDQSTAAEAKLIQANGASRLHDIAPTTTATGPTSTRPGLA